MSESTGKMGMAGAMRAVSVMKKVISIEKVVQWFVDL